MYRSLPLFNKPRARNVASGPGSRFSSRSGALTAVGILALAPAAWFRFGIGTTVVTGVSQWDDQSGNARHLKQATVGLQPALQGDGSILFDGVDDFLKCTAFTLNQPTTVYLVAKQVTWVLNNTIFDGNAAAGGRMIQNPTTPSFLINAGGSSSSNANWAVGAYAAVCSVFNGVSSLTQVNSTTATSGNTSTNNMGGFTLGSGGTPNAWANVQVKEVILFPVAHDALTRARVIDYLTRVVGLA